MLQTFERVTSPQTHQECGQRHLRILKDAGLVKVELDGREHIYRLDNERLLSVAGAWIQRFAQ